MIRTLLVLGWLAGYAVSQNISASITGTVADSSNAPVMGAEIISQALDTGFRRVTRSNESGYFSVPDLTPAAYTLTIRYAGFKSYTQSGIALNSGDQRSLGRLRLVLGELAEMMVVTAEPAPVQLGSSEKSGSITHEMLQNIALRGRDMMDAVGLLVS